MVNPGMYFSNFTTQKLDWRRCSTNVLLIVPKLSIKV
jgi:hypothetical protein